MEIRVEDPRIVTSTWTSGMIYGRPLGEWIAHVCAGNMHEYYNGKESAVPTATEPDL